MLPVELGHRALVGLTYPAQQLGIISGRFPVACKSRCAGIPVRVVHLWTSPGVPLGE